YLINTGWSGGPAGVGKRMNLAFTRAMVTAALDGSLAQAEYRQDPLFQLFVPTTCPDVPDAVLQPRSTWQDPAEYDMTALQLAKRFIRNMEKFGDQIPEEVLQAGPVIDGVK
ncbi:MAG: phosphoenolpyruvate carboxykinase (ATP), partial [Sporomusaceae bacterium]|nr:phosphoenolpyruvate carboxykinase (ATP) [Sporomusaceae bacterium]